MRQTIKKVAIDQILSMRQKILRPGYALSSCYFDGDREATNFHLALFEQDKIVAIASYMKMQSPHILSKNQYRLRGMAVDYQHQGRGHGQAVFKEGERILKSENIPYLWFNARRHAVEFYQKQGCRVTGEEFMIPTVGPHYFMFKTLMV